jgi:hypothetical protein
VSSTVLHIGFHKTGTTALQSQFFTRLPNCAYLTRVGPYSAEYRALFRNLRFAGDGEYLQDTVGALMNEIRGRPSRMLLISDEGLSGMIWRPSSYRERIAERLYQLFPEGRIVICVRNQSTMLRSMYSSYVKKGGSAPFGKFVDGKAPHYPVNLDHLCYDTLVERYQTLFGRERVLVLPFEMFVQEQSDFLSRLSAFIQAEPPSGGRKEPSVAKINQALSPASLWTLRRVNVLFRRSRVNPKPVVMDVPKAHELRYALGRFDRAHFWNSKNQLSRTERARLGRVLPRYQESNQRLSRLTGLPLGAMGYPLPRAP